MRHGARGVPRHHTSADPMKVRAPLPPQIPEARGGGALVPIPHGPCVPPDTGGGALPGPRSRGTTHRPRPPPPPPASRRSCGGVGRLLPGVARLCGVRPSCLLRLLRLLGRPPVQSPSFCRPAHPRRPLVSSLSPGDIAPTAGHPHQRRWPTGTPFSKGTSMRRCRKGKGPRCRLHASTGAPPAHSANTAIFGPATDGASRGKGPPSLKRQGAGTQGPARPPAVRGGGGGRGVLRCPCDGRRTAAQRPPGLGRSHVPLLSGVLGGGAGCPKGT